MFLPALYLTLRAFHPQLLSCSLISTSMQYSQRYYMAQTPWTLISSYYHQNISFPLLSPCTLTSTYTRPSCTLVNITQLSSHAPCSDVHRLICALMRSYVTRHWRRTCWGFAAAVFEKENMFTPHLAQGVCVGSDLINEARTVSVE